MTHTSRSRLKLAAIVALPLLGLAACAETPPPQPVTPPAPTVVSTAQEAVGVVRSVNLRTRQVQILTPANRTITVVAPESVQNLNRVRRGDRVRVRFEEAVAVQMTPRGTDLPAEADLAAARATSGLPAGAVVATVRDTVTVNAVDPATNAVTFTSSRGVRRTVVVRAPEMQAFIRTLRPGQRVNVAFVEATAVSIEPAAG